MGLILLSTYLLITLVNLCQKKSNFVITLVYLIIAPQIKFGNRDIDAMYIVIIYFIFILLLTKKNIKIYKDFMPYLFLIVINFYLFFIMTVLKHYTVTSAGFAAILGFLKMPALIILISSLFEKEIFDISNYDKIFKITLFINLFGVLLQFIFGAEIRGFFENMYLTDNYKYYSALSDNMVYNRKFGFFSSPMLLGAFSSFLLIYFIERYKAEKKISFFVYIVLTIVLGITSLSKTFIIGIPSIFLMYYIFDFILMKKRIIINKKNIKNMIVIIILLPIVGYLFVVGYNYMAENSTIEYYMEILKNPISALETRYGSEENNDLLLSKTYEIIDKNFVFGVGFQSLDNEFLGDSSFVLALHNGGILSLGTIIVFYFIEVLLGFKEKNILKIVFVIFWGISGLGLNNLFNVLMILPFLLICLQNNTSMNWRNDEQD